MSSIFKSFYRSILANKYCRFLISISRCFFLLYVRRREVLYLQNYSEFVSENTIFSNSRRVLKNQKKHPHPSAKYFLGLDLDHGGGKSDMLICPSKVVLQQRISLDRAKVLVVGPRNEAEILNLVGHGFSRKNIVAIDLFSYSPWITLGDMHNLDFLDDSFDFIMLGWVIAYSDDKRKAVKEICRVAKPGATIALSATYSPLSNQEIIESRGYLIGSEERINSVSDLVSLFESSPFNVNFCFESSSKVDSSHLLLVVSLCPGGNL